MKALIGRKLGMTQLFDENGNVMRVTIVEAGPCVITQIKTDEVDGYQAIQLGFEAAKKPAKPQIGHATHNDVTPRYFREVRLDKIGTPVSDEAVSVGDTWNASTFIVGDDVEVTGTSKGKGFAGTIKRHNFHRGPKTHGSHNYRAPGSIGSGYPQHVLRGQKMAGRMGGDQVTTKGLKIVLVDAQKNLLALSGAVPGPRKSLVMIREAR